MNRNRLALFYSLVMVAVLSGCMSNVDNRDEEKIIENQTEIENHLKTDSLGSTAVRDTTGLYYIIRKSNPTGNRVKAGDAATVRVWGYLLNGTKVLSIEKDSTYTFPAFANLSGLPGLERSVFLMRTGEKATFFLPYYLGFGNTDRVNVPAYSPIRLEVELLKARSEVQQIEDYIAAKKFEVSERTPDNLFIIRTNTVTGDMIGAGKSVNVKYIGKFLNEKKFDEGTLTMTTGTSGMIQGFDKAVQRMRKTEKAIIIMPSSLGYKSTGYGSVPPYAPLQFEIEVL